MLAQAPAQLVDAHGHPAYGKFEGLAEEFNWRALGSPYARNALWRRFHHKRWHYVALATEEVFCGIAIVDVGWTNTAFAYVYDRKRRRVVGGLSRDGLPGLTASVAKHAQGRSRFRFPGQSIEISPAGLKLRCKGLSIKVQFSGTPPVLLACGPVEGGSVHATQKSGALAMSGDILLGDRRYALDGGAASYDYSNGLLARETGWRWASAHSQQVGFNLQAGYFGAQENALWIDQRLVPLSAAQFEYNPDDPMAPWHVWTDDGLLDLHFTPEGARREDKNLLVAASRYIQPIGTFNGTVRASAASDPVHVSHLAGVTEDHFSRW